MSETCNKTSQDTQQSVVAVVTPPRAPVFVVTSEIGVMTDQTETRRFGTMTDVDMTSYIELDERTIHQLAFLLRQSRKNGKKLPIGLASELDCLGHELVMLRRTGDDVSFISGRGGRYKTYRRIPQSNDGCSASTVQLRTRATLKTIRDYTKKCPHTAIEEIEKRIGGMVGKPIVNLSCT
jgi:hypothetical protein